MVGVGIRLLPQLIFNFRYQPFINLFPSMVKFNSHTPKGWEVVQGQVIRSEFTLEEILQADIKSRACLDTPSFMELNSTVGACQSQNFVCLNPYTHIYKTKLLHIS